MHIGNTGSFWRFPMVVLLTAMLPAMAAAQPVAADVTGQWLTQDRDAVIQVDRCGSLMCGRIVGVLLDRPDSPMPTDTRGHSQCGLQILELHTDGDLWKGTITNPENNTVWRVEVWLAGENLHVRGYLGITLLGQTQVWTRYAGRIREDCRLR